MKESIKTQYTEKMIRRAFLELLREKSFSSIQVKEICKRADINRGTFYLHYENLNELMRSMAEEMENKLISLLPDNNGDPLALYKMNLQFFLEIRRNPDMQVILLNDEWLSYEPEKLMKQVHKWLTDNRIIQGQDSEKAQMQIRFVMGGYLSLIRRWKSQGFVWEPEKLAGFMTEQILGPDTPKGGSE